LTPREIDLMDRANPHGIGLAWLDTRRGTVEYLKGLTADETIAMTRRLPLPQIVHFRFASVGGTTAVLGHPFPVGGAAPLAMAGSAPSVVFHNGTWTDWRVGLELLKEDGHVVNPKEPWSDTRVMAAMLASYSSALVAEVVGAGQKLAILHGDGKVELFGEFMLHRGVRVSNLWWRPRPAPIVSMDETWSDACDLDTPTWTPPRHRTPTPVVSKGKKVKSGKRRRAASTATQTPLWADIPIRTSKGSGASRYFPRVPRPVTPARRGK
jgi:hypothetical protein